MNLGDQSAANARITLRSLIAARWVLVALAGSAVLLVALAGEHLPIGLLPSSEHPLALVCTLLVWAALNGVSLVALRRQQASEGLAGAQLLIDAVALTVLLALSGGPANPFTILYFLPITLATQVSPRWTWALAMVCVACFAGLFVLAPIDDGAPESATQSATQSETQTHTDPHAHHHGHEHAPAPDTAAPVATAVATAVETGAGDHAEHFEGHQRGMWVAFGIAGVLITVFVHRTALALARQRDELARLRQAALEDRHLTAVGTLAAGAAHELGTPLGTIALLVDELPHMQAGEVAEARATIREQLARCKLIVSRMASPELRISALGAGQSWPLSDLIDEIGESTLSVPLQIDAEAGLGQRRCRQPFEVLSQLLRELLSNAAEACRRTGEPGRGVAVRLFVAGEQLAIDVVDRGVGMDTDALASAFDPFHSTRPEGQGMGLGLYLARAHLRQLGGSIVLESQPAQGTTVHVLLPFAAAEVRP